MSDTSFFKRHIVWFLIYAVIVTCAAALVMFRANSNLKESQNMIIANQNKSEVLVDSLIKVRETLMTDSIKYRTEHLRQFCDKLDDAIKTLDTQQNNSRIVSLLELEFSKIQSEYDVLNLWCALLTVVFLIFSFFSIFKTNEMSNQSEAALSNMRKTETEVRNKSDELDKKIRTAEERISEVGKSIEAEEKRNKDLSDKINSLENEELPKLQKIISDVTQNQINLEQNKQAFQDELTKFHEELKTKFNDNLSSKTAGLKELIAQRAMEVWSSENKNNIESMSRLESEMKSLSQLIEDLKKSIAVTGEKDETDGNEESVVDESEEGLTDDDEPTNKEDKE